MCHGGRGIARWTIVLFRQLQPAVWTIEKVPAVKLHVRRMAPYAAKPPKYRLSHLLIPLNIQARPVGLHSGITSFK